MVEGAIVSCGPVLMHPQLIRCHSGPSDGGDQKLSTSSELTSSKLSDRRAGKSSALGVVPGDGTEVRMGNTYEQGESGRGEGRQGNGWMSPYITPPSKRGVMTRKDHQEVAGSTLVKGIELKMAALIWHAAPGYLWWNCTIFGFACSCVCTSH
jgi:hypothetical protein